VLRPKQHVIDSKGKALLRGVLAGFGWAVNELTEDYSRDYEVEVFRDGKSTGITFSLQLKSTESPAYSADGSFVSVRLEAPNARHLAIDMQHPVLLVSADVTGQRMFWATPQIDVEVLTTLKDLKGADSCTVRVPVANELPATEERLVEKIGLLNSFLAARNLMTIHPAAFTTATATLGSEELSRSLREKSDTLDLREAQKLTDAEDFEGAREALNLVITATQPSAESKFYALLLEEKNERLSAMRGGPGRAAHDQAIADAAIKLQELTREGPAALKLYALLFRVAADFYELVREDWGLFQNWKVHQHTGDVWWRATLRTERAALLNRIVRKFNQFVRLVRLGAPSDYQSVLPIAFLRIVDGAALFLNRLELEGLTEPAEAIRESALRICQTAAYIAGQYNDSNARMRAVVNAAMLSRNREAKCVLWARHELEQVSDPNERAWGEQALANQFMEDAEPHSAQEDVPMPMEREIYENMARALGIELGNPEDPIASLVQIGLDDLDPTRVLRTCTQLFLTLGRRSPGFIQYLVASQLQLGTMGMKVLHCKLHKYTREGYTLDGVYAGFDRDYCSQCPDRSPHAGDWEYSHAWQRGENELNREFMDGPQRLTHRPMPPSPPHVYRQPNNADEEEAGNVPGSY
jgi:Domain of unknown function (DUF4365)